MGTFTVAFVKESNQVRPTTISITNSDEPDLTLQIRMYNPEYVVWIHDLIADGIAHRAEKPEPWWQRVIGRKRST